jgi:hypothetical protein
MAGYWIGQHAITDTAEVEGGRRMSTAGTI